MTVIHAVINAQTLSDEAHVALISSGWNRTEFGDESVTFTRRFRDVGPVRIRKSIAKRLGDEYTPDMVKLTKEQAE